MAHVGCLNQERSIPSSPIPYEEFGRQEMMPSLEELNPINEYPLLHHELLLFNLGRVHGRGYEEKRWWIWYP